MEKKKKKSNLFIWLGLGAAAVLGFMAFSNKKELPKDRFGKTMTANSAGQFLYEGVVVGNGDTTTLQLINGFWSAKGNDGIRYYWDGVKTWIELK